MIRRIVTALILVPLAIIVISFAVANRQSVVVSFDPFDQAHPALTRALPLYLLMLGASVLAAHPTPPEATPRLMIPPPAA